MQLQCLISLFPLFTSDIILSQGQIKVFRWERLRYAIISDIKNAQIKNKFTLYANFMT